MRLKGRCQGFTLIELIVAMVVFVIALLLSVRLLLAGVRLGRQFAERERAATAGDAVFEFIANELGTARRVYIGGSAGEELLDLFSDPRLERVLVDVKTLELEAVRAGKNRLRLTVRIRRENELLYERTETVPLLNTGLGESGDIEGGQRAFCLLPVSLKAAEEEICRLWYQPVSEKP